MKVWIDLLTPKQAMMAKHLSEEFERLGFEVVMTTRRYGQVLGAVELLGIDAKEIGEYRYGLEEKLRLSLERAGLLLNFAKDERPDLCFHFLSPEAARVSFGLGIPSFAESDSPHAEATSRLTVPLSTYLFTPWIIPKGAWARYGISRDRIIKYRALDPMAWLKGVEPEEPEELVLVRMEEARSSYLLDKRGITEELVDRLSKAHRELKFVVLSRYGEVGRRGNVEVLRFSNALELLRKAKVAILGGGTMTQEAALLGIPTISTYPSTYLIEERYLIPKGFVSKVGSVEEGVREFERIVGDYARVRRECKKKAEDERKRMIDPAPFIASKVESLMSSLKP